MMYRTSKSLALVTGAALALLASSPAWAQNSDEGLPPPPPSASPSFRTEPTASQTLAASLRYFHVHPEQLQELRAATHARALVPQISASYRYDNWGYQQNEQLMGMGQHTTNTIWNQVNNSGGAEVTWDLRDLVFNSDEMNVFGLWAAQREVIATVTSTYFTRRQLLLRLQHSPPEDPVARDAMVLRIEEFTATLDMLTGGWFSRTSRALSRGR